MTEETILSRIQSELTTLKAEEVRLDNSYRYKWNSGMAVYSILQDLERIRKRKVELEIALNIIEEYEHKKCYP